MINKRSYNFNLKKNNILMNSKYLSIIRTLLAVILIIPVPILIAGKRSNSIDIPITYTIFENKTRSIADALFESMQLNEAGLSKEAFLKGWQGYNKITQHHCDIQSGLITIVDFSKPSNQERLFVIDLNNKKIVHASLVAHGRNSGLVYAKSFSNQPETYKSSLGFYKTLNTYTGENGFSLRLEGLEKNINDKAYDRAIVMHGADYVSQKLAKERGYIGRSYGCPAIPHDIAPKIIKTIKNGSLLFIYHPSKQYDKQSKLV
jgi:hypothetical protein